MQHTLHCPAAPVYTDLGHIDGIARIWVPNDDEPETMTFDLGSRVSRALLVIAVQGGEVDLSTWSAADLSKLFGASPRNVSEAKKLSIEEQRAVAKGQRPLFPPHSSVPPPLPVFDPPLAMRRIVETVGTGTALDMLAAESEAVA